MLTKSDIKIIKDLLKHLSTKDGLKRELKPIKEDITKLKETTEFTKQAVINLLDWSQDIHDSIVKEKLPERVKKLEHLFKSS